MKSFISWLQAVALTIGGPGLFTIAFLDSSFVSLPQINDLMVVLMVTREKAWMPYYVLMATAGSVLGCYVIYFLAEKGGDAFLRKRLKASRIDSALAAYQRHGMLALVVPALLPPPAPFKLFVLMAGVAGVTPLRFVMSVALARGCRYVLLGWLAIRYGDAALALMQTRGRDLGLAVAGLIVLAALGYWLWKRRPRQVSGTTVG